MKIDKVQLAQWFNADEDNIDIDWPKIQKLLGREQVEWLLKQPTEICQLVVEKSEKDLKLIAEFYDKRALVNYHLMWAK
jgi:hypothetical protein